MSRKIHVLTHLERVETEHLVDAVGQTFQFPLASVVSTRCQQVVASAEVAQTKSLFKSAAKSTVRGLVERTLCDHCHASRRAGTHSPADHCTVITNRTWWDQIKVLVTQQRQTSFASHTFNCSRGRVGNRRSRYAASPVERPVNNDTVMTRFP